MDNQFQDAINGVVKGLQSKSRDLSPVMTKVMALIKSDIEANFRNYGRTSGETSNITIFSGGDIQWKGLAPSTIKAYSRKKGKGYELRATLDRTHHLRNAIGIQRLSNWQVMITGNMPYSAIHQYGGTIHHSASSGTLRLRKTGSKKTGYKMQFAKSSHKRATTHEFKKGAYDTVIPPRPYITLTPEDVKEIVDLIGLYIVPQGVR
jgi:phage gpG-like protein